MSANQEASQRARPGRLHQKRPVWSQLAASAAAFMAGCAAATWAGPALGVPWWAWAAAAGVLAAGWLLMPAQAAAVATAPQGVARDAAPESGDGVGTEQSIARQVVPVWRRTVDAARVASERDASALLERFASISASLDVALAAYAQGPTLELGGTDDVLARHQADLDTLQADTRLAMALRDRALHTLEEVAQALQPLQAMAQQVRQIARATHMLALNASVEATRAGAAGQGFALVAKDVGGQAEQSRLVAAQLMGQLQQLADRLSAIRTQATQVQFDEEDIRLRGAVAARTVLRSLLGSLGELAQGSRSLREAGRQAQSDIDAVLVALQGQDRLTQMLGSVCDDMSRLSDWLAGAADPAAASPAQWLERLESSYTMEEMRTAHHGTAVIERQAAVEFF